MHHVCPWAKKNDATIKPSRYALDRQPQPPEGGCSTAIVVRLSPVATFALRVKPNDTWIDRAGFQCQGYSAIAHLEPERDCLKCARHIWCSVHVTQQASLHIVTASIAYRNFFTGLATSCLRCTSFWLHWLCSRLRSMNCGSLLPPVSGVMFESDQQIAWTDGRYKGNRAFAAWA